MKLLIRIMGMLMMMTSLSAAGTQAVSGDVKISIIPRPLEMKLEQGEFTMTSQTRIVVEPGMHQVKAVGKYCAGLLGALLSSPIAVAEDASLLKQENVVLLTTKKANKKLGVEGYELTVTPQSIVLQANDAAGFFHGVQTLLQLMPVDVAQRGNSVIKIPGLNIKDKPRFPYRGMHLDVSRHFMPVAFVKKYIDLMAMVKMNTFHWHLTDDQGWRIEIKKYPKLTEISAWRKETIKGHAREVPREFDGTPHGGFYTQEEIKDIVAYAQSRFITIIPEIEMPGHSQAALAAYPDLSCSGGPIEVLPFWGITEDVFCAGKEQTFEFLTDVLTEVIALFPSTYIHIGGDECPKKRWKDCPDCQARIKAENLKDEYELQSYFVKRIEKFLISKNKRLIGWDEILEGGLAPEATVMSWRGMSGGIQAAQQGHDVIMTPTSHCYFDYYQGRKDVEPLAIGGFLPLKTVYSLEPVPSDLNKKESKHILGAQANVWTEYIQTPEHVEYMILPRMLALSEVVWSPLKARDWDDFRRRLQSHFQRFDQAGINYSRGSFIVDISARLNPKTKTMMVTLESEQWQPQIYYTLDGSEPSPQATRYTKPFTIDRTTTIKAAIFQDQVLLRHSSERTIYVHAALGKEVKLKQIFDRSYPSSAGALVDGLLGTENLRDGFWQAYRGVDFEGTIDLKKVQPLHYIQVNFLQDTWYRIAFPSKVEFEISNDGKQFTSIKSITEIPTAEQVRTSIKNVTVDIENISARYVRIKAQNRGALQERNDNHEYWIFVDEIIVE